MSEMTMLYLRDFYRLEQRHGAFMQGSFSDDVMKGLYEFVEKRYGGADFFDTDFEHEENFQVYCRYMYDLCSLYAFCTINIPDYNKKCFIDEDIAHSVFYNIAYFWGFLSLFDEPTISLCKAFGKEISNLSIPKILQYNWSLNSNTVSEADVYDFLSTQSLRQLSVILTYIDTSDNVKNILKKCIISKDEDLFIKTIIESNININNISVLVSLIPSLEFYASTIQFVDKILNEGNPYWVETGELFHFIEQRNIIVSKEEFDIISDLLSFTPSDIKNKLCIPNLNWNYLYNNVVSFKAIVLYLHQHLKYVSNSFEVVSQIDNIIGRSRHLNFLNEAILSGETDPTEYIIEDEALTLFRNLFITLSPLPKNTLSGPKDTKKYIESGRDKQDYMSCTKIYKALAKAHMLSFDDETHYSFVYRFSKDYEGKDEPKPITWLGEPRELYEFIYWFENNGDSSPWKKGEEFFVKPDGSLYKMKGRTTRARKLSPRMTSIIKELNI